MHSAHTDRHFHSCFVSFSTHFIYFKMCLYLFPKLLFIFRLFGSFLFPNKYLWREHNFYLNKMPTLKSMCVRVCACGGVFQATCEMIQLKAITKRERTFWFSFKILTWNWNIWLWYGVLLSLALFLLLPLLLLVYVLSRLYFLFFFHSTRESLFCCIEDMDDGKFTEYECTVHNSKCLFKW